MSCQELSDIMWVCKLIFFFPNSCEHLNDLNIKLQGSSKTLDVKFDYIKSFQMKLKVFKKDVDNERFKYFPYLKKYISDLPKDGRTDHLSKAVNRIESIVERFFTKSDKFRELEKTSFKTVSNWIN